MELIDEHNTSYREYKAETNVGRVLMEVTEQDDHLEVNVHFYGLTINREMVGDELERRAVNLGMVQALGEVEHMKWGAKSELVKWFRERWDWEMDEAKEGA